MKQNLISIIMPIYKTEEGHLKRAIESVINQSYQRLEILLVDDGSPDSCGKICDLYARKDNRIRVIHKINGGVSSARNHGLKAALGDYILFVDSDDELRKNAIEILAQIAQNRDSDITICSCKHRLESVIENENYSVKEITKTVEQAEAIQNLSYNIPVFEELEPTAVWGKLYKKTVIENLCFNENMNIGEDFVFNYYAICNAKTVTYCSSKLYIYNYVETSLMHNKSYSPRLMRSFYELVKFEETQNNTKYSNDIIVRCINISFTIYLKIPEKYFEECSQIEDYIKRNRKLVIKNAKVGARVKAAIFMSYIGFGFVRKIFKWARR